VRQLQNGFNQDALHYSPSTSKSEQDESVDGYPMSRHTCPEEGANAQDDDERGENDRNAIAVQCIVMLTADVSRIQAQAQDIERAAPKMERAAKWEQ